MAKAFDRFILASMGFSGGYKLVDVWDAKVKSYDGAVREMLLGEKVFLVGWHTVAGLGMAPIKVACALNAADVYCRGLDPDVYLSPKVKCISDHVFW